MLALLLLALLPRILGLDALLTTDEARFWSWRSEWFLEALQQGEYARTSVIGHPGVTTMWLGATGLLLHGWLTGMGWIAPDDLMLQYALMRLPLALITSLSVVLGYLLLRRLLDARVALLAALFWATDPFLVAHSRVLHLDALLTSFVTLALLAALLALSRPAPADQRAPAVAWGWLAASALAGGLAFLTKSPSVILLPMLGLIALGGSWRMQRGQPGRAIGRVLARAALLLLVWGGIALGTWVLLWPAAWVDLPGAVQRVVTQVRDDGGSSHSWGNFFLGRPVADPGPLFYPLAIAFRLTPWMGLGLLLALAALFRAGWTAWRARARAVDDAHRLVLSMLAIFVVLFALMMSLPPKKFDRYLLPIFPALSVFAAVGWVWLLTRRRLPGAADKRVEPVARRGLWSGVWVLVAAGLVANLAWYHPYYLSYYNPLLGGGPLAARTVPVGWGEGLEQAGAYISQQFNGCDRMVVSWYNEVLQPFTCTFVERIDKVATFDQAGYVVLYVNQLQRQIEADKSAWLRDQGAHLHTVRIHGIEYARVYQAPPPVVHPLDASFGQIMRLRGYDLDTAAVRSSGTLTLTLDWQARAPMHTDYMLFVHVLDDQGQTIAQVDVPPGGPVAPTSAWQAGQFVTLTQSVPVPADLPDDTYWLTIGVYDPADFNRLPLQGLLPPGAPYDGAHALPLGPFG